MDPPSTSPERAATTRRGIDLPFLAAVLVALFLWGYGVQRRSFWLDEFHSLHHDRKPGLAAFLESVRSDNHPPLSFALQRTSVGILGESEFAMRLPTLLVGVGLLLLTRRVARRLPDEASRRYAVWLVVLSSFSFDVFTEARMYGLLALSVVGLMESALCALEGKRSRWWAAFWVLVGLHSHYYFFHSLLLISLVAAVSGLRSAETRRRVRGFAWPVLVGVLGFVPWAVWGFREQLQHGLPPGGNYSGLNALAQSIGHLFFLNASAGGALTTFGIALPGTCIAALFGVLGFRALRRASISASERRLLLFLVLVGLGVPFWSHGISVLYARASYGWRYIAGSLVPVALLVAAGTAGREAWRRHLRAVLLGTLAAVTLIVAIDGGRENYRAAVAHILRKARPGDAVLTRPLWEQEPEHSPTGWEFYAQRVPLGARQVMPTEIHLDRRRDALDFERVWVFTRDLRHLYVIEELRQHFEHEAVWPKGRGMVLHLFWNGSGPEERIGALPSERGVDTRAASH